MGIVTGSGGRFRPNDSVTRGELSAILNRLLLFPSTSVNPFHDLTQDKWYYSDMLALANERIIPVYISRNYYGSASASLGKNILINCGGVIVGRFQGSVSSSYSTSTVSSVSNGVTSNKYGIVGFGEGRVTSCADLTNTAGGLYHSDKEISKKDALDQNTYTSWAFKGRDNENGNEPWMMSQTGYPLPMLVGVNESLQRSQVLPSHLR